VKRAVSYIRNKLTSKAGVSLIELVVTMVILSLLAMVVLPSAQLTGKRLKEMELRRTLRTIRTAIDDYKKAYDEANKGKQDIGLKSGYPKELKVLVEGEDFGDLKKTKKKFLRRVPVDPFNPAKPGEEQKWGIRAYKDEPDSKSASGDAEDVYDVYSLSEETAIDGTKYKEW
jgi:general secretion pathway protein G